MDLTREQLQRYIRHLLLPEVGEEGQKRLLQARVFIVGAGGLGSPVGYYLAAAGVGTLGIADDDAVDLSNLQRQIAHSTERVGMPKALSAKKTFESLNPDIKIIPVTQRLSAENILGLFRDYDIIADCSDNFATRFLVNDACVMAKKPLVTGAVLKFEGQLTVIVPGEGPCYRCLFQEPPAVRDSSQEDTGIFGFLPGVIGTLQTAEIIKLIIGKGEILKGDLLVYDALKTSFRKVNIPKNPGCALCGDNPSITELKDFSSVE